VVAWHANTWICVRKEGQIFRIGTARQTGASDSALYRFGRLS